MQINIATYVVNSFQYCTSLTSITIPSGVTIIDNFAFADCGRLTSITVLPVAPPTLGNSAILTATTIIYVPSSSVKAYKTASGWRRYASKIQAIP